MNTYIIQYRLHTLAQYYTSKNNYNPSFELNGVKFSQWDFNFAEGHKTQCWIIEATVTADSFRSALLEFRGNIFPVISMISLLSQCYSEILNEPYLVQKEDCEVAFFRYTRKSGGVPLVFGDDALEALKSLQNRGDINTEFFYYWNDMLNVTGYSAKLLLCCSALEALAKSPMNKKNKHDYLRDILGHQLHKKIWGDNNQGIRHRLVHGEYFNGEKDKENYLQQMYKQVVEYFNNQVFDRNVIRHVVNPQRHPDGNKEGGSYFIKQYDESSSFHLKGLVEGCDKDFSKYMSNFELISESDLIDPY